MVNLKKLPTHPLKKGNKMLLCKFPSATQDRALSIGERKKPIAEMRSLGGRKRKMNPGETGGWGILGGRNRGDNVLFS